MSRRPSGTSTAGPCARLLLLVIASRPAAVKGFAVIPHGGSFGIRSGTNPAHRSSSNDSPSGGLETAKSSRRSCMLFMGASRDDRTGRKDQWEGWDMEEDGTEEDAVMDVKGRDWRLFRKNLISRYGEDNGKDPWGDGCWAHDIGMVEPGSLLVATEKIVDSDVMFHQSVILVLHNGRDTGTVGLVLNKPGPQRLHSLAGLHPELAGVFGDCQVFCGGPIERDIVTVLHDANVEGSELVLNGVYALNGVCATGVESLIEATRQGKVSKDRVRFVHGCASWSPGQLQGELNDNEWFVAAAAPELITQRYDQPFDPLWGKVLRLMGGTYREVAQRNEPWI